MADTATTKIATATKAAPVKSSDERDAQTPVDVELKTPPNDADLAGSDTLAKSYLVSVDDNTVELSDEFIARQFRDMRQTAMQRGLRPLGEPECVERKPVGKRDVLLRYTLKVAPNTTAAPPEGATAVDPMQSATGEPLRKGDKSARTADGKTVDTTSPATAEQARTA